MEVGIENMPSDRVFKFVSTFFMEKNAWFAPLFRLIFCAYLAAGVVSVFGQFSVEALEENLIGDFADIHAGFVQHREDAFMLLLHQIHDDLVVEVVNLQTEQTDGWQIRSRQGY